MKDMEHSKLYEKNMELSDEKFKQIIGVKKETFEKMFEIVAEAYAQKHRKRGRHSKLSIDEILFMTLKYWREYVTQISLAHEFGVGEATVHDWIVWVETVLVKSGIFTVKGKKELLDNPDLEIIIIDATESPVQRPKRGKKSGIPASKKTTQ
jgi:DNA-binding transcriptional regulator YiaG